MANVKLLICPTCGHDLYIDDLNACYQCLKCVKKLVWETANGKRVLVEKNKSVTGKLKTIE